MPNVRTRNIQTICLAILAIIAIGTTLHFLQRLFIPLIIAGLLSLMLAPLVSQMASIRIPRIIGIIFVMGALFVLFFAVGRLFYSSLQTFTQVFGDYQERFVGILSEIWTRYKIPQEYFPKLGWTRGMIDRIVQVTGSFVSFGTNLALVLFFLIFMLAETPLSWRKFRRAFPRNLSHKLGHAINDVSRQVARYLTVKTIISAITGLLVWLSLSLVGQDLAALWGLMSFLLNFIPNLGSFFIIVATMLLGLAQFYPEWNRIIAVWILMPGIQLLMGNILDPMIQGDQLDLSPLFIMISLVLWGWILGLAGMFLAVPLTVALKIILDHIPEMRPVAVMMGSGKPHRSFRRQWIRGKRQPTASDENE